MEKLRAEKDELAEYHGTCLKCLKGFYRLFLGPTDWIRRAG